MVLALKKTRIAGLKLVQSWTLTVVVISGRLRWLVEGVTPEVGIDILGEAGAVKVSWGRFRRTHRGALELLGIVHHLLLHAGGGGRSWLLAAEVRFSFGGDRAYSLLTSRSCRYSRSLPPAAIHTDDLDGDVPSAREGDLEAEGGGAAHIQVEPPALLAVTDIWQRPAFWEMVRYPAGHIAPAQIHNRPCTSCSRRLPAR